MKTIAIVSLVAIGLVVSSTPSFADNLRLGGEIGLGTASDNVDDGLALQGYLEYDLRQDFALRGGVTYLAGDSKVEDVSGGELTISGVEAAALYKFRAEMVKLYIGAGIGYYMPEYEMKDSLELFLGTLALRLEEDLDNDVGFFLMGGVSVPLSDTVSLVGSAKYIFLEVDDHATMTSLIDLDSNTSTGKVDLNTLLLTAGLQIEF